MSWLPGFSDLFISPTALGFLPMLILHLLVLSYLLTWPQKSTATWFLIGWQACLLLLMTSVFSARAVYAPLSVYLEWMGASSFAMLGAVLMIQFAYHFPRNFYPGEARLVLIISGLVWLGLLGMMIFEGTLARGIQVYDFEGFLYGFLTPIAHRQGVSSPNIFDLLHPFAFLWTISVWLRQSVRLSRMDSQQQPGPVRWWPLLWRPRGQAATATRNFALLFVAAALTVVISALEARHLLPRGSFATAYLLAWFGWILVYVNNAPEATSFMAKLVGITLITLLLIVGLANPLLLNWYESMYEQARQTELAYLQLAIKSDELTEIPESVTYILARPAAGGLFSSDYRLLFSRETGLTSGSFVEQDVRIQRTLEHGLVLPLLREHPWLSRELLQEEKNLKQMIIPARMRLYRGSLATAGFHFIRYILYQDDLLYEVGYSYPAYRALLHRQALPLVTLTCAAVLAILLIFPYFFRYNLVQPLTNLQDGVKQVNEGNLETRVPVKFSDEIGFLTGSFNGMVQSLERLNANLRAEAAERQRAETEVRALNVTLEERVAARTQELSALYEVSAAASQSLDLEALLTASLSRTMTAIQSDSGAIYLLEEASLGPAQLSLTAQQGFPAESLFCLQTLPVYLEPVRWLMEQREPILIADTAADPHLSQFFERSGSLLLAPLNAGGQLVGLFCLFRGRGGTFQLEEVALLATIADQVGIAVKNEQLRRQATLLAERQRIARDLHDSATQALYGLVTLAEAGQAQIEAGQPANVARIFDLVGKTTRQALKEMRLFIHQLRLPDLAEAGLVGALQQRLSAVEGRANIETRLLAEEAITLPRPVEEAFYWVAREALNNTLRHAGATAVTVYLRRFNQQVALEVVDNGCGFNPDYLNGGGQGLTGMQERAEQIGAGLEVVSAPGRGTQIKIQMEIEA